MLPLVILNLPSQLHDWFQQKVEEEEAGTSKLSLENNRLFLHLINLPAALLAPTPANTPHLLNLSSKDSSSVQEQFKISEAWNHDFFWESTKPGGGGKPYGELLELINRDFGSFEGFVKEFKTAAATQFGFCWAWLAYKANRLDVGNAVNPLPSEVDKMLVVVKSPNAVNPLVWDYSNLQPDNISTFMEKLVSWEAVSSRLAKAKGRAVERDREEEKRARRGENSQ